MPADSGRLKKDRVDVFLRGVSKRQFVSTCGWDKFTATTRWVKFTLEESNCEKVSLINRS